jgi:putative holliday junction resolvase
MIVENDRENILAIGTGRILSIDFGLKRIGLAMCDPFQIVASTLKTLANNNLNSVVAELCEIIKDNAVKAVVVGHPLHMTGDAGEMVEKVKGFMLQLDAAVDTKIFLWDERWTTVSAEKLLIETGKSPSKNRKKIDQLAAAFLLQGFLDRISYLKRVA